MTTVSSTSKLVNNIENQNSMVFFFGKPMQLVGALGYSNYKHFINNLIDEIQNFKDAEREQEAELELSSSISHIKDTYEENYMLQYVHKETGFTVLVFNIILKCKMSGIYVEGLMTEQLEQKLDMQADMNEYALKNIRKNYYGPTVDFIKERITSFDTLKERLLKSIINNYNNYTGNRPEEKTTYFTDNKKSHIHHQFCSYITVEDADVPYFVLNVTI